MSAKGFILFVLFSSLLSLSIVLSFIGSLIWQAFGNYILIGLACLIVLKIAFKLRKIKHSKTPNA
jgi:pilus assembly protein TadC